MTRPASETADPHAATLMWEVWLSPDIAKIKAICQCLHICLHVCYRVALTASSEVAAVSRLHSVGLKGQHRPVQKPAYACYSHNTHIYIFATAELPQLDLLQCQPAGLHEWRTVPVIWPQAKACQLKALDMLSYVHTYLGFCYRLAAQPSLVHQLISRYVVTAQPVLTY